MDNSSSVEANVLLIDDNKDFVHSTGEKLKSINDAFSIFIENSGKDGKEFFKDNSDKIDVIVCDYDMPGWTGIETLKNIREFSEVPFILFTGKGSEEVASEAISAGASDYLQKGDSLSNYKVLSNRILQYVEKSSLLAEKERTLQERNRLLERVDDAFFSYDEDFRLLHLNESGLQLLWSVVGEKVSYDEVIGNVLWDVVPQIVIDELQSPFERAMNENEDIEFDFYYPDEEVWLQVRLFPSESGLSVFVRDITEKKERIARREKENEVLFELYQIASTSSLSHTERLSKALQLGRDFLGVNIGYISSFVGSSRKIILSEDSVGHSEIYEGASCEIEDTFCKNVINDDRTIVNISSAEDKDTLNSTAIDKFGFESFVGKEIVVDGEVYGSLCFADCTEDSFLDSDLAVVEVLTAWVSYEIERNQKQEELEVQNRRLEAFAEFVSHDLKNPLNVASGYVEMEQQLRDDPSENLAKVQKSHKRMEQMIDELLELSRSSEELKETAEIQISEIVEEAWSLLDTEDATLGVKTDMVVNGDGDKLLNVFENLFLNSIEHNDSDVSIEVGEFESGFYIADNGSGIDSDVGTDIFNYGYTEDEGHGLGLAIAKEIVDVHGWSIEIDSDWNGAKFNIYTK